MSNTTIALLNTSIVTSDGKYELKTITLEQAIELVSGVETDSAIGHDSTAQIMSDLLGITVMVNRQQFVQSEGQKALVFKLNGRAPEGVILNREEVEKIGYSFKLLTRQYEVSTIIVKYQESGVQNEIHFNSKSELQDWISAVSQSLWHEHCLGAGNTQIQSLNIEIHRPNEPVEYVK